MILYRPHQHPRHASPCTPVPVTTTTYVIGNVHRQTTAMMPRHAFRLRTCTDLTDMWVKNSTGRPPQGLQLHSTSTQLGYELLVNNHCVDNNNNNNYTRPSHLDTRTRHGQGPTRMRGNVAVNVGYTIK